MTFVSGVAPPAIASPGAHWFVVEGSSVWVRPAQRGVALASALEVQSFGVDLSASHYLGQIDGEDCFAVAAEGAEAPSPFRLEGLRALYGLFDEETFAVAGRAVQIAAFGLTHRYCGRCGRPALRDMLERCMRCAACELAFYPRIAPAIIVLVRRRDEALLARSARFTSNFYSTLAGFVEPGESLEQTLAREVREEVGIELCNMRYFGSQPWPFPHSLMVGFFADYAGGELAVDGTEIVDARWFSKHALPPIPPKPSIARRLIEAWISGDA
jgi:NAD+ diphosphatase